MEHIFKLLSSVNGSLRMQRHCGISIAVVLASAYHACCSLQQNFWPHEKITDQKLSNLKMDF